MSTRLTEGRFLGNARQVREGERWLTLQPEMLSYAIEDLSNKRVRFVTEFIAENPEGAFVLYTILSLDSEYLVLEAPLKGDRFTSLTESFPAAEWSEREIHDLFGVTPLGNHSLARLVLPGGWPEGVYPMRKSFPKDGQVRLVPMERQGPVMHEEIEGDGVFHMPYGPIRSGIFESAQFVVDTPGEKMVGIHLNMFYKHRGMEKLFEGTPFAEKAPLVAERVSGTDSFAQSLAYCQAVERALGIDTPPRARHIRVICAELERIYNHIDHVAGHCEGASLNVANAHFTILKERVLRLNSRLTGSRYLRGMNKVGGLRRDISIQEGALRELRELEREFRKEEKLLINTSSFMDRIISAAPLSKADALTYGAVGPIARGSDVDLDCRRDRPYSAYPELDFHVATETEGDADARFKVRVEEVHQAFSLIFQAVARMPAGPISTDVPQPQPGMRALGWAEGGRGEELYYVAFGPDGALDRVKIRTASFANWSLFKHAIEGQVLTDFVFMEHSFALSQAGCDR